MLTDNWAITWQCSKADINIPLTHRLVLHALEEGECLSAFNKKDSCPESFFVSLEHYGIISCDIKKRLLIPPWYEKTSNYPCYHFFSFLPHGKKPHQVQQSLYLSAITGGPVTACWCPLNRTFTFRLLRSDQVSNASPKPSSICTCTSLSISELLHKMNLHICIFINAITS